MGHYSDSLPKRLVAFARPSRHQGEALSVNFPQHIFEAITVPGPEVGVINGQPATKQMRDGFVLGMVQLVGWIRSFLVREASVPKTYEARKADVLFAAAELFEQLQIHPASRMILRLEAERARDRAWGLKDNYSNSVWMLRATLVGMSLAKARALGSNKTGAQARRDTIEFLIGKLGSEKELARHFPPRPNCDQESRVPGSKPQLIADHSLSRERMAERIKDWSEDFKNGTAGPKGEKGEPSRRHYRDVVRLVDEDDALSAFDALGSHALEHMKEMPP